MACSSIRVNTNVWDFNMPLMDFSEFVPDPAEAAQWKRDWQRIQPHVKAKPDVDIKEYQEFPEAMIQIGSYFVDPDAPEDVREIYRDLARRAAQAEAERQREPTVSDWFDEVLDRCEKHVIWHTLRAENKFLHQCDAEQELMLMRLAGIIMARTDEEMDAALDAAHEALRDWKAATECHASTPEARVQCAEVDQGDLGELLRSLGDLEILRRAERDGTMEPLQVAKDLTATMAAAPGLPPMVIK
jgi:hypothetical protein